MKLAGGKIMELEFEKKNKNERVKKMEKYPGRCYKNQRKDEMNIRSVICIIV